MATETERPSDPKSAVSATGWVGYPGRRAALLRSNFLDGRALTSKRRRDTRFRVIPFDRFQIANGIALAVSVGLLLAILLDPHLVPWQATLPEGLIAFFDVLTDFGRSNWILIGTGTFFLVTLLLDASALSPRLRARRTLRAIAAGYVFVAVAGSGILVNIAKIIFGRARPKLFEDAGSYSFDFAAVDSDYASFPSGHATTAMALGVALALLFPRLRWLFLCIGVWIALSRMFVRAHYPSDVLAGCLIGGATAWLLARLLAQRRLVFGFDDSGRLVRRTGASGRLF